jgi:hypothetical protein
VSPNLVQSASCSADSVRVARHVWCVSIGRPIHSAHSSLGLPSPHHIFFFKSCVLLWWWCSVRVFFST